MAKKNVKTNKKVTTKVVKKVAPAGIPDAWFIMSRNEITVEDLVKCLPVSDAIEVWPLVGVLEIMIAEKQSIDIEMLDADFGNDEDNAFLHEKGIKSVFSAVCNPAYYDEAKPFLDMIAGGIDGFICGDTDDFKPVIGELS